MSTHISNRERRRRAEEAIAVGTRSFLVTLALLAQKGGEMIVTQGTLDQVTAKLQELDYEVVPNPATQGEFIVRLLESANT